MGGAYPLRWVLTLKFERATWPFKKIYTRHMKPIDIGGYGEGVSDVTLAILLIRHVTLDCSEIGTWDITIS